MIHTAFTIVVVLIVAMSVDLSRRFIQLERLEHMAFRSRILDRLRKGPSWGVVLMREVYGADHHNLYATLRELERDGLVESWEGEPLPQRGFRPRRYYRIYGTPLPSPGVCP